MNYAVLGAKAGSKKARTPVVSPDSAQSKTYMRLLLAISEGEIVNLDDLYKRIYLNETPLMSDDGSYNFQDVKVDFRTGTNDQAYIEGFPDVASEIDVNVELKSGAPYVRAFNNLDLDGVNIRIKFGALRTQNATSGDVTGVTIQYAIDLQTDGGTWTEVLNTKISDKTSTNYERSHRVNLPKADSGWQVRVRRLTPNATSELISDKMYIAAVTEVIDAKLSYPNVALLGLQFDAETFGGSVPKIAILAKGLIIRVPSNYNPVSRTYSTPIWDGLFKDAYTDNPAWHFYNTCIEKRYALGHHINSSMIDKWDCYRLAQWCDQLVSDGKGGQEPRFRVNVYQQNQEDAWAFLQCLAGVFRAFIYWDGTAIRLEADVPQDVEFVYTQANVIEGNFEYTGTRKRDRHSVAYVKYDNPANLYKTETVVVSDDEAIQKYGINPLNIDAWGVTSEAQAQRAGLAALISEKYETRLVTFKVGLDGHCPRPGRVFGVADYLFAGRMNGGRVAEISENRKSITLDRDDVVARAGDRIVINDESGKAQARIVESVSGRIINVTFAFDENSIAAQNIWAIDAQDLATMKFRCVSITQDEKHQFTITGLQYNPAKFNAIDFGTVIDDRPISIINPTVQKPVESVTLSTEDMVQQGITVATMNIVWPQAEGAVKYQVEWRKDDGSWMKLPTTGNNSIEVQGIYSGNYQAKVSAINAFDVSSLPTYSLLTSLEGKQGKPPKLASIQATGILFGMKLYWGFPAVGAMDTAYTEIQVSPNGTANIAQLGLFAYPTTTHTIQGLQPNLKQFYRGRLIDRIGNAGDWSDWTHATTSTDASDILDLLNDQISESQLNQDLIQKIDKIDVIEGDLTVYDQRIQDAKNTADQANQNLAVERQQRITAVNQVADNIASESQARISAVENLSDGLTHESQQRTAGDEHVLSVVDTYKQSTENSFAAVRQEIDIVADDLSAASTKLDGVYAKVTPLTADQDSWTADSGSNEASSWSIQSAYTDGDSALGQRIDTINVQVGSNQAAIQEERTARASGDEANAQAINNYIARNDTALASVKQTAESAVSASSSNSSAIQALDNRVDVAESDASVAKTNAASAITKAETAVSTAGSASSLAQQASATATAASNTASTANSNASNAMNTANTANNSANEAKTNAATALSTANAAASESAANASQINSINVALGDKASTGALNSVKAEVDEIDGRVRANTEKVDGVYAKVTPLTADQDSWTADSGSNQASSWSIQSAQVDGDSALGQRIDIVSATMAENDAVYKSQIQAVADANSALVSKTDIIQTTVNGNTASIQQQWTSINGIYSQEFIKTDVNGHIAGRGSMNDGKVATMIFNYDAVYFGAPSGVKGIPDKPLMALQANPVTLPNGTVIPRGMYLENANIGYLSASRIYADSLSAISANLGTIQVGSANIENGAIDTLKIQDEAVTVPIGVTGSSITKAGATFYANARDYDVQLKNWEDYIGNLCSITIDRSGGKCSLNASVCLSQNESNVFFATNGNDLLGEQDRYKLRMVLSIYSGSRLIGRSHSPPVRVDSQVGVSFAGTIPIVAAIDDIGATGEQTYVLKFGFAAEGISGSVNKNQNSSFTLSQIRMTLVEMKK